MIDGGYVGKTPDYTSVSRVSELEEHKDDHSSRDRCNVANFIIGVMDEWWPLGCENISLMWLALMIGVYFLIRKTLEKAGLARRRIR